MNYKFTSVDQMWKQCIHDVFIDGRELKSRAGDSLEIIGWSGKLIHPRNNVITCSTRNFSVSYACAELLWYLSMSNKIEMIKAYAPQYENFSDDGKTANGAYGYRWKHNLGFEIANILFQTNFRSQLHAVIALLKKDPNTRQAVMTMWDSRDLINSYVKLTKDTPCNLTWSFFLRNDILDMVCNIRSNDLWLGFPYDIFCNTCIQRIIANDLGVNVGTYTHQVGSLHIYMKHYEKCYLAVKEVKPFTNNDVLPYIISEDTWKDIDYAINCEYRIRNVEGFLEDGFWNWVKEFPANSLMLDILLGCATKWDSSNKLKQHIFNPNLKKMVQ